MRFFGLAIYVELLLALKYVPSSLQHGELFINGQDLAFHTFHPLALA